MPRINNTHPEYLTEAQVLRIAGHCRSMNDAMLVKLLFYTGARISEILAVKPEDIDFQQATVKLPALKRKELIYKLAVIPGKFLPELRQFLEGKPAGRRLFIISRQIAYGRIRIAAIMAGIDGVYCHLLRDSLATNWALKGGDLTKLQRQLGHKSLATTTDRYIRYSTGDIRREMDRVFERERK